ncbi:Virulence-protein E, N-terminal [uncultured Caudovirales phage]|uniref:Virulence-protein E, N-terminal n=1 Tax=uncultured Caudovirales phage TaxID=2100421 RepID=A0A6J5QIN3_9CAUD|nr:Virulence-protein E, N-terminal [uncultured Caudovirales phage]
MDISLFVGFKGSPHTSTGSTTITDFISSIKYGTWREQVEPIRLEENKDKREILKKKLPTVTIGGLFKIRSAETLIKHSGFICIDIDCYTDKSELAADPYTYSLFKSVSGKGLAVIAKINPEKHAESYNWLASYYYAKYGITSDPLPKNVASLRFVSYDPDIFVNEKSLKAKTIIDKPKKVQSMPIILPQNKVEELIKEVCDRGINIAEDYADFLNLGFALWNGFGEDGRRYYHTLCSASSKYLYTQCDKQYNICSRVNPGTKTVTVGTFYWLLKKNGIQLPVENKRAVQLAAQGKKNGRSKEGILKQLVELENISEQEAEIITAEVMKRDDIEVNKLAKTPEELIPALIDWIGLNHPIRINSITKMIEENGTEVKKERLNTIYLRARIFFNSKDITKDIVESVIFSDHIPTFNPIAEYIERNRHRTNSGNIDNLIASIETDTPCSEIYIRKWLLSLVAAYEGNPVRSVLSFVGGQNTGKTEWFRRLMPSALRKYYAESKLDNGKDDELLMCQKLIVMDDEMGGKSRFDEKRFKDLTSKHTFSLRAPYGRYNEDFKRLAVLCGTSNEVDIINDPTGNTRILPVNIISIHHDKYNSVDKDELFMEVVRAYESGEEWQLNKSELAELSNATTEFEKMPFERELISQFFKAESEGGFVEYLTATQIKNYLETNTHQKIFNMTRFGIELKKILGDSIYKKQNGVLSKVYAVIKTDAYNPITALNSQMLDNEPTPF